MVGHDMIFMRLRRWLYLFMRRIQVFPEFSMIWHVFYVSFFFFFIFLLLFQIEQSYFIDCNKLGCTGNTEDC